MRTYHIQIELPEGCDEFWEELARMKQGDAKKALAAEVQEALEEYSLFDAKIDITRIDVSKGMD